MDGTLRTILPFCFNLVEEHNSKEHYKTLLMLERNLEQQKYAEYESMKLAQCLEYVISVNRMIQEADSPYEVFNPQLFCEKSISQNNESHISQLKSMISVCIELARQHCEALMFEYKNDEALKFHALEMRIRNLRKTLGSDYSFCYNAELTRDRSMLSAAYLYRLAKRNRYSDLCLDVFGARYCY